MLPIMRMIPWNVPMIRDLHSASTWCFSFGSESLSGWRKRVCLRTPYIAVKKSVEAEIVAAVLGIWRLMRYAYTPITMAQMISNIL